MIKKIDAHSHIGLFSHSVRLGNNIEELVENMYQYNIEKTLLTGRDSFDNLSVYEAYKQYPSMIIPIVYANPLSASCLIDTRRLIEDYGFKAIKINPFKHAYVANDKRVYPLMELAQEYGLPVFIHSGDAPYSLPWSIGLLAKKFPQLKIVMLHMGLAGIYVDAAIDMAKSFDNIYLEISGMPMSFAIKRAYEEVGRDRVIFGVDSPFQHPSVEIQKVISSGLSRPQQEDVFYHNIKKLLNLE